MINYILQFMINAITIVEIIVYPFCQKLAIVVPLPHGQIIWLSNATEVNRVNIGILTSKAQTMPFQEFA